MSTLERREFVVSTLSVLKKKKKIANCSSRAHANVYYICGFWGLGIALSFEYDI
jgi:hypothetical protein